MSVRRVCVGDVYVCVGVKFLPSPTRLDRPDPPVSYGVGLECVGRHGTLE